MLNFKQYLQENESLHKNAKLSLSMVRQYLKDHKIVQSINSITDNKIIVNSNIDFSAPGWYDKNYGHLPFKFGKTGQINLVSGLINSFENFPDECSNFGADVTTWAYAMVIRKAPNIKSLEHITPSYNGSVDLKGLTNCSFHDIHKYINKINGELVVPWDYCGPLLGVFKIKNLQAVKTFSRAGNSDSDNTYEACKIITKYLKGDKNIWKCQDELQDLDLDDYADF